jgi:hypothetical protein
MVRSSTLSHYLAVCLATTLIVAAPVHASSVAAPTAKDFMRVLDAQIQRAKPRDVFQRTIVFDDVRAGEPEGNVFPFTVSVTIHDYNPGYPPDYYFGRTCITRIVGSRYVMRRDRIGEWVAERNTPLPEPLCVKNPGEGKSSFPLDSLRGTRVGTSVPLPALMTKNRVNVNLRLGEYACTWPGGGLASKWKFRLKNDKTYTDLDGKRGGTYVFEQFEGTLRFNGGFLDKMGGPSIEGASTFKISPTLTCAPWG